MRISHPVAFLVGNDGDELFLWNGWPTKDVKPFQPRSLSVILTSQISDMPQAGFEPVQNLSSGFAEWSCAIVLTITQ